MCCASLGRMAVSVSKSPQTAAGPLLRLTSGLKVELSGALDLEAETIRLHGRTGVTLSSGGDVAVYAHDDVRLDGTRIRNNC